MGETKQNVLFSNSESVLTAQNIHRKKIALVSYEILFPLVCVCVPHTVNKHGLEEVDSKEGTIRQKVLRNSPYEGGGGTATLALMINGTPTV